MPRTAPSATGPATSTWPRTGWFIAALLTVAGLAIGWRFWSDGAASESANVASTINTEPPPSRVLRWVDRTGATLEDVGSVGPHENVALASGGDRFAETRLEGTAVDIWLGDLKRGTIARFTSDPAVDDNPVWSPDDSRIVFASARNGDVRNLYVKNADGSGREELLLTTASSKYPTDWSRDGRYILYTEVGNVADIWVLPMAGSDRKPTRFLTTLFSESRARFSPDGQWIAYTSNEVGPEEVFVQSFPYGRGKWRVSWTGGVEPHWRADGRELFYVKAGSVWAVDVERGPGGLAFGYPHKLFDVAGMHAGTLVSRMSASPDGQRFLLTLDNTN